MAARDMFAAHGPDVNVRKIAAAADIGVGTLFRHFATKTDLVNAILVLDASEWIESISGELEQLPAWQALERFIRSSVATQAKNKLLSSIFASLLGSEQATAACREIVHPVIDQLVERAHADGGLRSDVSSEDIGALLIALGHLAGTAADDLVDRQIGFVLDGLRPSHRFASVGRITS